jgi:hypothetical protein
MKSLRWYPVSGARRMRVENPLSTARTESSLPGETARDRKQPPLLAGSSKPSDQAPLTKAEFAALAAFR